MPPKPSPLLCELHAHTTWSDGAFSIREICDLYGRRGFDVLAITDHTTRDPGHVDTSASTPATSPRSNARRSAPSGSTACSSYRASS